MKAKGFWKWALIIGVAAVIFSQGIKPLWNDAKNLWNTYFPPAAEQVEE